MVDLLTTILGLPEAESPLEHKILAGEGEILLKDYEGSIKVAHDLASDLNHRPESNPSRVRSMLTPIRSGKDQIRSLKDSLAATDSRIRKFMSENINLARVLVAITQLQKAQSEEDPEAIEEARAELTDVRRQAHLDLTRLYPDVKASLRYRLQFARKWKEVLGLQLELCDLLIACLTQALREKAGLVGDVDRQIRKLIERGGSIIGPDGRPITLRDLLPESAEEIRELIGVESEEMNQLFRQRDEMKGTIHDMGVAEVTLEDEINRQGISRLQSPALGAPSEEKKKSSQRMVFRERGDGYKR
ncbi:MAG: hypothetical protein ABIH23_24400 [bacterium]